MSVHEFCKDVAYQAYVVNGVSRGGANDPAMSDDPERRSAADIVYYDYVLKTERMSFCEWQLQEDKRLGRKSLRKHKPNSNW